MKRDHKLILGGALALLLSACCNEPPRSYLLICQQDGKETYRGQADWWKLDRDGVWESIPAAPRYRQSANESCRVEVR